MRKQTYVRPMSLLLNQEQRTIIERVAERQETTLAMATRYLIDKGIRAVGLKE